MKVAESVVIVDSPPPPPPSTPAPLPTLPAPSTLDARFDDARLRAAAPEGPVRRKKKDDEDDDVGACFDVVVAVSTSADADAGRAPEKDAADEKPAFSPEGTALVGGGLNRDAIFWCFFLQGMFGWNLCLFVCLFVCSFV